MKLLRYGAPGDERPGILDNNGDIRDLGGEADDIAGPVLRGEGLDRIRAVDIASLPVVGGEPRIGPCIGHVGKIIGIGLNFSDHAEETGMEVPPEPVIFFKATSSIIGPHDDVLLPPGSEKSDWEVELGVVIGEVHEVTE